MQQSAVTRQVVRRDARLSPDGYNFRHFRAEQLLGDLQATREKRGVPAGALAPDFELPRLDGGNLRLSTLRGQPALLHFGSLT